MTRQHVQADGDGIDDYVDPESADALGAPRARLAPSVGMRRMSPPFAARPAVNA